MGAQRLLCSFSALWKGVELAFLGWCLHSSSLGEDDVEPLSQVVVVLQEIHS